MSSTHIGNSTAAFSDRQLLSAIAQVMVSLFLCHVTEQDDSFDEEAGDGLKSSAAVQAVQEHVHGIAALQRVQASQAGYSADPALQAHRPKLRDHR